MSNRSIRSIINMYGTVPTVNFGSWLTKPLPTKCGKCIIPCASKTSFLTNAWWNTCIPVRQTDGVNLSITKTGITNMNSRLLKVIWIIPRVQRIPRWSKPEPIFTPFRDHGKCMANGYGKTVFFILTASIWPVRFWEIQRCSVPIRR